MRIPTHQECLTLLQNNHTPQNIIEHCIAVSKFALNLSKKLQAKGIAINIELVNAAALLHDIEKSKPNHVQSGHDLLSTLGYGDVAQVMKKHGLENFNDHSFHPVTIEEKIVFYADKRVQNTSTVPMVCRFEYIKKKYNPPTIESECAFAKNIEMELSQLAQEEL